jgi:TPR repeat protein
MNYDVFISYNHLSINLVEKIAKSLEADNINCWYAPRNLDDDGAGELYDDVIAKTIPQASVVVVVVTDSALASKWVKMEVTMADDQGKSIIPFEIAPTTIVNGLTSRLAIRHKITAYPNPEEKIGQLVKNVKRKLNELSSSNKEVSSHQQYFEVDTDTHTVDFYFDEGEALYSMKEYVEAAVPYLKSALQGNSRAKERLCSMFYHIKDIKVIPDDIWEIIEPQAEKGHCYACFLMSCKYHNNPQTNNIAYDYLRKAIRTNTVPLALLRLGIYYGWGMGVRQSSILSMLYYKKAIDAGCKEAYSYIGIEYLYGDDKYDVDKEKGISYLKKGVDMLDRRSMSRLANEYADDPETIEKAREIAQLMIEQEYYEGYCILGNCLWKGQEDPEKIPENIKKKAKEYYLEAINNDESSAYGCLALFFYLCENNETEAIKIAKRGRQEKDSYSLHLLGGIYQYKALNSSNEKESNEFFENAWQFFGERYEKYGIGSVNMSELFLEYGYTPKQYQIDETSNAINKLKGDSNEHIEQEREQKLNELIDFLLPKLEVEAHKGTLEAIVNILRLHCLRKYGNSQLNYNIITDVPEIAPLLAFGANKGENSEMTFYYGKFLLENEANYNVGKGIKLVENAADKKDKDAINYLIERYGNKEKRNDDDEQFFFRTKEAIDEGCLSKNNMKYISRILFHKREDSRYKIDIEKIRSLVESYIKPDDASFLRGIGDSLGILYPNFDEEKIFNDYKHAGKVERWLFYSKNYANNAEKDIDLQDEFLEKLHSLITFDESLMDDVDNNKEDVKELMQAMVNYQASYRVLCKKEGVTSNEYRLPRIEYIFPYMPSSVCAKISYDTFDLFLSLHDVMPDIYAPILPILNDDSAMLDYCETIKDQDLQLFLIELVEIRIDIEAIMLNNWQLYNNYKENNKKPIVDYLNKMIEKYGDKVTSKEAFYTLENLPDLSEVKANRTLNPGEFYETEEKGDDIDYTITSNKQEDDDEFEKLLNDFINSSFEEDTSKQK